MLKKFKITIIILLIISIMYNFIGLNKLTKDKENKKLNVENVSIDAKNLNKDMIAFMIQGDNGNYTQSSSNTWPGEKYRINEEKTGCIDTKGEKIENSIEYDSKTNKVVVIGNKTSYCYLYFDIKPNTGGSQILDNLPTSSGLSSSRLGDMKRYQGASPKNYICINDTGTKCESGSNEMYRIIGIIDKGEEEGQIKVIKETSAGNYAWHSTDDVSKCSGTRCSWPNNDLAVALNSTFLNSLSKKVQEKIVSRQWYYGDIGWNYSNIPTEQMYQIESGQINTTYYDMTGNLITNDKWKLTSTSLKIGLLYIHDFSYAANSSPTSCRVKEDSCSNCWIIKMLDINAGFDIMTMTRIGRWGITDSSEAVIRPYFIDERNGMIVSGANGPSFYARSDYPVFYLSSDVKIKSGGTGEASNPYILELS